MAARNDGKTVVNGLWVDHSYDIGMQADTTSVSFLSSCFFFLAWDLSGHDNAREMSN